MICDAHNPSFIRRLVAALTAQLENEDRQDALERTAAKRAPKARVKQV
jgi:hypothetical protein